MVENLAIGSVNLCVTVFIHGAAMLITTRSFRKWMNAPDETHLLIELLRVTFVWPSSPAMGCSFRDGVLLFPVIDEIYFTHHPESRS